MKTPVITFILGMMTAAVMISFAAETGAIRKAHALTVNVGVRLIKESIAESESRIIEKIDETCTAPKD